MKHDRRQAARTVAANVVCIHLEQDNYALVQDVSDGGIGFNNAVNPVMQTGTIHFSFSRQTNERIEAVGELAWTDRTKRTVGLRFTSVPVADREKIHDWVAQLPPPVPDGQPASPGSRLKEYLAFGTSKSDAIAESGSDRYPIEVSTADSRPKSFRGLLAVVLILTLPAVLLFVAHRRHQVSNSPVQMGARGETKPTPRDGPSIPPALAPTSGSPLAVIAKPPVLSAGPTDKSKESRASAQTPPARHAPRDSEMPEPKSPAGAENGESDLAIAQRYLWGTNDPECNTAAAQHLWAAVGKGNVTAEITLADLYVRGIGVTKNCDQATMLLTAASKKGNAKAAQKLAELNGGDCR